MTISVRAFVNAASIVGGLSVFMVGTANLIWPAYALEFLQIFSSVFPGFEPAGTFASVIVATLYATVVSAVCAALLGGLYNYLAPRQSNSVDRMK